MKKSCSCPDARDAYYGRYLSKSGRLINLCNDHLVNAVEKRTIVAGWHRCPETPGSFEFCTCGLRVEWKLHKLDSTLRKNHYGGYGVGNAISDTDHCDVCDSAGKDKYDGY
jgi:hypothetical protein